MSTPARPTVGENSLLTSLSILVVSTDLLCNKLKVALTGQKLTSFMTCQLIVHTCQNVQDILKLRPEIQIDFIVFIIDPQMRQCLQTTEEDLLHLNGTYLFGRTCLVKIELQQFCISSNEVWEFCKKYGLHLLVDDILDQHKCNQLALRIITLATGACGLKSGMSPYIGNASITNDNDMSLVSNESTLQ